MFVAMDKVVHYLVEDIFAAGIVLVERFAVDARRGGNISNGDIVEVFFAHQFAQRHSNSMVGSDGTTIGVLRLEQFSVPFPLSFRDLVYL